MKILLLAMPDTADWQDHVMRIPNLAILSLGAALPNHDVRVLDLLVVKEDLKTALDKQIETFQPDLIGLSAMTFQFSTLLKIADYLRTKLPAALIVAGGYHVTLMYQEIVEDNHMLPLDFMVRGEGEQTIRQLVDALEDDSLDYSHIDGLSWRGEDSCWVHNQDRALAEPAHLTLPDRDLRQAHGFHVFNRRVDVIETSRGCPLNCNFCSIRQMYGQTFRRFPIERIMEDIRDVRARGARILFICDDNITYDIEHFKAVCEAIIEFGYNDIDYSIQASAYGIAKNPELVPLMDRANIRTVSLGLESMDPASIKFMKKATSIKLNEEAVSLLRSHNIGVNALFIIGFPDDTRESIKENFHTLLSMKPDTLYCQVITPYPKTEVRTQLLSEGLVENVNDYSKYDGYHCNVRTKHLTKEQLWHAYTTESLKSAWPLISRRNIIFKRYFIGFITCEVKVLLVNFYRLLSGKPREWRLDL